MKNGLPTMEALDKLFNQCFTEPEEAVNVNYNNWDSRRNPAPQRQKQQQQPQQQQYCGPASYKYPYGPDAYPQQMMTTAFAPPQYGFPSYPQQQYGFPSYQQQGYGFQQPYQDLRPTQGYGFQQQYQPTSCNYPYTTDQYQQYGYMNNSFYGGI